jgi:hypothetical protein
LPDDLRRTDNQEAPPDSLPRPSTKLSVAGSPPIDGGMPDHPIHDDDLEDLGPEDFEEEIELAARARQPQLHGKI